MRRKLETVLRDMSQSELARCIGVVPSRISQLKSLDRPVYVVFDGDEPVAIHYEMTRSVSIGKGSTWR